MPDQPRAVARVQPDRRLVEHVERVHQRRADRGRQVDALELAAGERARLAVERQVAEPDLDQVAERGCGSRRARAPPRSRLAVGSASVAKNAGALGDGQARSTSAIVRPPMRKSSASGLSAAPSHAGQVR